MPPPTIAKLKSMGLSGFRVTCDLMTCRHSASLAFEAAGVDDSAAFPSISERRRFVCSRCGGRAISIMPDWRGHKASGIGDPQSYALTVLSG
jgi:hypothetical protein